MNKLRWFYRAWRYRLKLEIQEIAALRQLLGSGDIAIDIGAHKGAYTYWMLKQVGASGKIFAFEPQPVLCRALQELAPASRHANVKIENMGLSSASGVLNLNVPLGKPSPGASFENRSGTEISHQSYPVQVTTLDEYFQNGTGEPIQLIKCDAEGHELEVFRGGENLLRRQHPQLLFECESRHRPEGSVHEVFAWLTALGYEGKYFGQDGLHDISSFDPAIHQASNSDRGYVNNFLFSWPEQLPGSPG